MESEKGKHDDERGANLHYGAAIRLRSECAAAGETKANADRRVTEAGPWGGQRQ